MVGINTNLYTKTKTNSLVVEAVDQWLEFLRLPKINVHTINVTINQENYSKRVEELSARMLNRFIKNNDFDRVIAVGSLARRALSLTAVKYSFGVLPHPVLDTKILVDKKKMLSMLNNCKEYIYGKF